MTLEELEELTRLLGRAIDAAPRYWPFLKADTQRDVKRGFQLVRKAIFALTEQLRR